MHVNRNMLVRKKKFSSKRNVNRNALVKKKSLVIGEKTCWKTY